MDLKRQADELLHQAALLRANPPPRDAEERRRRADQLDQEAAGLREQLAEHLRAEKAANRAARDATTVLVRFVRDLGQGASVGDYLVTPARGPVRQHRAVKTSGSHPLQSEGQDVEVQPGEARELPGAVAEVLLGSGHIRVLTDPDEIEQARAELVAAGRQGG